MLSIRIAAAAWLGLLGAGALAGEAASPSRVQAGEASLGASLIAGHFRLTAPDGATVDSDALSGKPYGVFFGFTHCPDICPTTLATLSMALAQLSSGDVTVYFISVDPERDTPDALAQYMTSFDPRIVALSGTRSAVDEAVSSFGVIARRTDLPGGGYVYGHTAAILLVDDNGLIVDRVGAEAGPDRLAEKFAALLRAGPLRAAAPSR